MVGFPKPRPAALERQDRRKKIRTADLSENAKVKARSRGYCELMTSATWRCNKRASHVHHRLSGIGVRGIGASAKAENKLHLCNSCHSDIHAHILVPDGPYFRRRT